MVEGITTGIKMPALASRFQGKFSIADIELSEISDQLVSCAVNLLTKTVTISVESTMYGNILDLQLEKIADDWAVQFQLQYMDGCDNVSKFETFRHLTIIENCYEFNYADSGTLRYKIKFQYKERLLDAVEPIINQ